jgi:hypothetical protein
MQNIKDRELELNSFNPGALSRLGTHLMREKKGVLHCRYDFAQQGGAVGPVSLFDPLVGPSEAAHLPAGAIITKAMLQVLTSVTSGGAATVALTTGEVAADLLAATAKATLVAGLLDGKPDGTAAKSVVLTAERTLQATIAVAALTAGKIDVFVEYIVPAGV